MQQACYDTRTLRYHCLPWQGICQLVLFISLTVVLSFSFPLPADAEPRQFISIVTSRNDGVYQQIIELTRKEINKNNNSYHYRIVDLSQQQNLEDNSDYIISIGTSAAEYLYQRKPDAIIISALLTQSAYTALKNQHLSESAEKSAKGLYPLLLNQPFSRFLQLGSTMIPGAKSVGILLGPTNRPRQTEISHFATSIGLKAKFAYISETDNPVKIIDPVIRATDFFVVLPDQQAINQAAATPVLQLSFRHKTPVIAYSGKYVKAGALAAVFSSPKDIAKEIAQALDRLHKENPIKPEPGWPTHFSVDINASVARSLQLRLDSKHNYQKAIKKLEASQ
jgi:ABC-type uncharacterized transport system substrate-binding protein